MRSAIGGRNCRSNTSSGDETYDNRAVKSRDTSTWRRKSETSAISGGRGHILPIDPTLHRNIFVELWIYNLWLVIIVYILLLLDGKRMFYGSRTTWTNSALLRETQRCRKNKVWDRHPLVMWLRQHTTIRVTSDRVGYFGTHDCCHPVSQTHNNA